MSIEKQLLFSRRMVGVAPAWAGDGRGLTETPLMMHMFTLGLSSVLTLGLQLWLCELRRLEHLIDG